MEPILGPEVQIKDPVRNKLLLPLFMNNPVYHVKILKNHNKLQHMVVALSLGEYKSIYYEFVLTISSS